MAQNYTNRVPVIAPWHRNLLIVAAAFTVLLIAMGGILCVTQSIRNCPDWPGCFGTFIPPSQPGPILEYTHRALAAVSGLLILSCAIVGLVQSPRVRWIAYPPLAAGVLLVEVSYFGAQVVLRGLAPGWAAVDVGSALLVVALMVAAAVTAYSRLQNPAMPDRLSYKSTFSRLVLAATAVTYIVLVSGILVAGKGSISACLGWPIYSLSLFKLDAHEVGNTIRWVVSLVGIGLVIAVLILAWQKKQAQSAVYNIAIGLGFTVVLEVLIQVLILVFDRPIPLLIIYTITAAFFWTLLVALLVRLGVEEARP